MVCELLLDSAPWQNMASFVYSVNYEDVVPTHTAYI